MKLLHTADWHIGRTLNGYSLLDEQKHAFSQMLQIALDEKVDGIVIAGDIYDRGVPSSEAVIALDEMLRKINLENKIPIYAISGNHDSAKRLNYGREWMEYTDFHLNTLLEEAFTPIETSDTQIFLLPFFDPMDARVYYQKQGMDPQKITNIKTIGEAMSLVISDMTKLFDKNKKHLLITHFAVSPNKDTEIDLTSETNSKVGGLATLTTNQFKDFDYVMLGHIHTKFASPSETIRYSGSLVKFNVKEANTEKSIDIVDTNDDPISFVHHKITPHTDLIVLKETWETLLDPEFYSKQPIGKNWFAITIEDFKRSEHTQTNVRSQLQDIYGTVVELDYKNVEVSNNQSIEQTIDSTNHEGIVEQFYTSITGDTLSKSQKGIVNEIFTELGKEE
ncbi:exonuclease SbcCD subunit D [Companilactobacillus allii]|uniref:Nuclease SbcCD subunit D n=1 Tax=Companilactobacillus allii TaxID=1847728 RepID=A0A1P8Q1K6_9LACO|nr:exonuclease SbcCD subunit D [Companilactobacillus allii]APX71750.1 exonuclease sbcCD subunit D [Companilactobacillus allii]USQ68837.1 exonuclease SbcCD subunit D [Companilactobacillus allii]